MARAKVITDKLNSIETDLRFLANKTVNDAFTERERYKLSEMADDIAEIRIPIHVVRNNAN